MTGLIKIVKYKGKNGGFAIKETTLYRVDVAGINGSVRIGNSYTEENYATKEANDWQDFTGWPIKRIEFRKKYIEDAVEVGAFTGYKD